jgi:hypothetical protein
MCDLSGKDPQYRTARVVDAAFFAAAPVINVHDLAVLFLDDLLNRLSLKPETRT